MSKLVSTNVDELMVINESKDACGLTCFNAHKLYGVNCKKSDCKNWIDNKEFKNCVIIAAEQGPQTLQVIGDTFGVTRMRICQIEKTVLKKIASKNPKLLEFI